MHWLDQVSRFWPHFAAGFDLFACLLASGHALLHKRDTRAATIWIGVIWTLPALGPLLYLALGVNRIRRHALKLGVHKTFSRLVPENLGEPEHDGAEHLKHIARVVSRVVTQPLTAGNKIEPLVNGDEAFPAMLAAIESAKKSVTLCTYIFDNDASGKQFVAALERAVQRGVAADYPRLAPRKNSVRQISTRVNLHAMACGHHQSSQPSQIARCGRENRLHRRHQHPSRKCSRRPTETSCARFAIPRRRPGGHAIAGSLRE